MKAVLLEVSIPAVLPCLCVWVFVVIVFISQNPISSHSDFTKKNNIDLATHSQSNVIQPRRVSSTQPEHLLSKAMVKHDCA